MAKKNATVKSMGDAGIAGMTTPGKGYKKPRVVKEGQYQGVDRDADVLHSKIKKNS